MVGPDDMSHLETKLFSKRVKILNSLLGCRRLAASVEVTFSRKINDLI